MAGQDLDAEEDDLDASARTEADSRVGQTVGGKYKILRTLGVGGMGAVYEVEHELIGKRMALKCLHPEYARDRDLIERFRREARAATAIGNEHIVDVTDMGDLPDGAPFLVMEMLKGQALADLLDREGALPIGRTCRIVRQICFALQAAHDKGIVHRDMKPENVFLQARSDGADFVKVLDFGISKMHDHGKTDRGLTRTGIAMGTPSYMSPEQAQGAKDVDHRTDIWAVGVMLYEMLTLRRPFEAESYPMMLMAIVGQDPEPLRTFRKDVPAELEEIVHRTLLKPVGLRTQTMKQLAEELLPFVAIEGAPELTGPETAASSTSKATRVARSKKSAPASSPPPELGTAGTLAAGSSSPPAPEPTPPNHEAVQPSAPPGEKAGGMAQAELRSSAATSELGTVERRDREPTSSGSAVPMQGDRRIYLAAAVVALLAIGAAAFTMSGPGETSATPPEVATGPATPPETTETTPITTRGATTEPAEIGPTIPAAPATEVAIQISTMPPDARIEIGGVEFPNPLNARRPRSLDPVTIRITAEGYETVERLAIFDHDQSFMFQLSRGRGVRREGTDGRVREPAGHHEDGPGTPAGRPSERPTPETETGTGGGFRDEF